ncbi:MAG: PIG-L deacetylase family protein [Candidatus Omnitrophota bacterium]
MKENVMVIAPHPDDETLGCGGTILKLKKQGKRVYWVIVTEMCSGDGFDSAKIRRRESEIKKISEFYGFNGVFRLGFPPAKLDKVQRKDIVVALAKAVKKAKPSLLFIPNGGDIHSDHRIVYDAVLSCAKTFRSPSIKKILACEILSETEASKASGKRAFTPDSFNDITGFVDKKIKAMSIYSGEMGKHPFPRSARSIRSLAVLRGAMSGCEYAEAFKIIREIW